ncbi:alpha/beta fold hydrolase [Desulfovibrio desulfuricans]|uniref:alpha/beta fold hydrolase n=1 Tax=Desulfovibrio desulfuricans TaxID=876 RepID=UPI0035B136C9
MKLSDFSFTAPDKKAANAASAETRQAEMDHASLESLFRSIVARNADAEALVGGGCPLSFGELDVFSERIARFIMERGYGPEAVVGVLCARGARYLAAAIGVMRAGAVYLPVESEQPQARKEAMLRPASLIIADSACLRDAEYFHYRNPGIRHVLCLDEQEYEDAAEKGSGLASTEYWEHVAEAGSDMGWKSDFDASPFPADHLAAMAAAVLEKSGLAHSRNRRVMDVGCGSGLVAQTLAAAATEYAAVDLARNELERVSCRQSAAKVTARRMEAADIRFIEGKEFDAVVLNGVVDNFPGYNHLRRVLGAALQLLAPDGTLFVGAVRDLETKDDLRAALQAYGLATGNQTGLLRHDASAELFVPRRFFAEWAAQCPEPVEVTFTPCVLGQACDPACAPNCERAGGQTFRYDVVIRRGGGRRPVQPTRFAARHLPVPTGDPLPACEAHQAAYIVYTSGSTGAPKGVVVEHRNLMHILRALRPYAAGCARVGLVAPLSFDASVQQLAVSIFCGNSLYALADEERKNPSQFCSCVRQRGLDLCDMTPAFFSVLVDWLAERREVLSLKTLLLAGEVLRPDVIRKFYAIPGHEGVVLYNVYGPTECTVDSSAFRIDVHNYQDFTAYPIGRPLQGVRISVMDRNCREVPDCDTGELWISGDGVSRGYLDNASPGAFVEKGGQRHYRTGDNGFVQNGLVYYRGREDQQVKIRGNRVELGEVEKAVADFPGVRQVAVVADSFRAGTEKSLAAYVVGEVDMAVLRRYLEQQLPAYCMPEYFVPMVELPFSHNRKIDKKALPSPLGGVKTQGGRRPAGPVEEKLAEIWKRLLGVDVTDADAGFFSLGGHSILSIRLIAMIEKELGVHVAVNELISHSSIARLAELLDGKTEKRDSPVIRLCHCEGGKNLFLFHPLGGSVFCYSDLAGLLAHKYTVYAVEAAGFSQKRSALSTELHSVEGLAEYYLAEILKVESQNIIFGGWSLGGVLAYETACKYVAMGNKPGPVIILDSVADNRRAKQMAAKDDIELLQTILQQGLAFDSQKLRAMPRAQQLEYLVKCGEKSGLLPVGFSSVQMDNLLLTYRGNALAAARYERPTPSDSRVLLVRALDFTNNPQILFDDDYQGWSRFLKKENIDLRWTEGTHESMLSAGLVPHVAALILEYLARQ